MNQASRIPGLLKTIGPGVVYAGAAIGVSHLVQSSRAGATYGFWMIGFVLAASFFKYPFFEFGHRYAAATGESLLTGYRRVGRWALLTYLLVSLGTGVPTLAAVTLVSAGLAANLFPGDMSVVMWSCILVAFAIALLAAGGYPWLDGLMKLMMVFLAVSTMVAVAAAAFHKFEHVADFVAPNIWTAIGIAFTVELMGWMPTPVDISAWPSLWMRARTKQTGHKPTLREALFDFKLGYIATTVMGVLFVSLGALVFFGSGAEIASGAVAFTGQLVGLYTTALGAWSKPFILTAALTCMLSTTLTVVDGYPRALTAGLRELGSIARHRERLTYAVLVVVMSVGGLLTIKYLSGRMLSLVAFVTTVAFLSAPLLAFINHAAMHTEGVPAEARPPKWLARLSIVGILFLTGFSILFAVVKLTGRG